MKCCLRSFKHATLYFCPTIMRRSLSVLVLVVAFAGGKAQNVNLNDSIVQANLVVIDGAVGLPMGDLADRFGLHGLAGVGWQFKSKQNLLFGISGHYLFGSDVREDSVFYNLKTDDGNIIGSDGQLYNPALFEQGFDLMVYFGGITNLLAFNPNSGITFIGGIGYLQHNIQIYIDEPLAPQLAGDYKKGYDRLTGGIQFSEYIGYCMFSNKNFVNFRAGIEFTQAFTTGIRGVNFDNQLTETDNRLDMMINLKLSWILPVYQKPARRYYTY